MPQMTKTLRKIQNQQVTLKFPSLRLPGPLQKAKLHTLLWGTIFLASSPSEKAHMVLNDEEKTHICLKINLHMQDLREGQP